MWRIRRNHVIADGFQHSPGNFKHHGVILYQKDGSPFGGNRFFIGLFLDISFLSCPREIDIKGRSVSRFAVYVDKTFVLSHNSVYGGHSQTGSLSHLFGGEKRLKDMPHRFPVHPRSVIADAQLDVMTGCKVEVIPTIEFIDGNVPGFDRQLSAMRHRVTGIHRQVDQDLFDLGRINLDHPGLFFDPDLHSDVLTDKAG